MDVEEQKAGLGTCSIRYVHGQSYSLRMPSAAQLSIRRDKRTRPFVLLVNPQYEE